MFAIRDLAVTHFDDAHGAIASLCHIYGEEGALDSLRGHRNRIGDGLRVRAERPSANHEEPSLRTLLEILRPGPKPGSLSTRASNADVRNSDPQQYFLKHVVKR